MATIIKDVSLIFIAKDPSPQKNVILQRLNNKSNKNNKTKWNKSPRISLIKIWECSEKGKSSWHEKDGRKRKMDLTMKATISWSGTSPSKPSCNLNNKVVLVYWFLYYSFLHSISSNATSWKKIFILGVSKEIVPILPKPS